MEILRRNNHPTKSVVLVSRHRILLEGLRAMAKECRSLKTIAAFQDYEEAIEFINKGGSDWIIIDGDFKYESVHLLRSLRFKNHTSKFLVITWHQDLSHVLRWVRAGAHAVLDKRESNSALAVALERVDSGHLYLPKPIRERILRSIGETPQLEEPFLFLTEQAKAFAQTLAYKEAPKLKATGPPTRTSSRRPIRYVNLLAGVGSFRLGLDPLQWKCVYATETDSYCLETYDSNFKEETPPRSLVDLPPSCIPSYDVLCAALPFKPFSMGGNLKGLNDEKALPIFEILRLARRTRPKAVLFENVKQMMTLANGSVDLLFKSQFSSWGYSCYSTIIDSTMFGIPQACKRYYFVAIRTDRLKKEFRFPEGNTSQCCVGDIIEPGDNSNPLTPKWQEYLDYFLGRKTEQHLTFPLPKSRKKLRAIQEGVDLQNCLLSFQQAAIRAISLENPFPTLSLGGQSHNIAVYTKERRYLSVLEIQRIMGFPDSFKLRAPKTKAIQMLCSSICPPVVEAIGRRIEEAF